MSTRRAFGIFDLAGTLAGSRILEETGQKVLDALAALYESLTDSAPPDAGAQEYCGHDHTGVEGVTGYGGMYLPRNLVGGMDGGEDPLSSTTLTAGTWAHTVLAQELGYLHQTDYLRAIRVDVAFKFSTSSGSGAVSLRCGGPTTRFTLGGKVSTGAVSIQASSDIQWLTMVVDQTSTDIWRGKVALDLLSDTDGTFELYGWQAWETVEDTGVPQSRAVFPGGGNATIDRWWGWAQHELMADGQYRFIDAFTLRQIWAALPLLYEAVVGRPAPGAASQAIAGHDHSGGGAGLPIPRGCIYSGGTTLAAGGGTDEMWTVTPGSSWVSVDSSGERGGYLVPAYVSPGIGSAYLEAQVAVEVTGTGGTGDLRFVEVSSGLASASASYTVSPGSLVVLNVSNIPCTPGWDWYDIQTRATSGGPTLRVLSVVLSEIGTARRLHGYSYPLSQAASAGTLGGL